MAWGQVKGINDLIDRLNNPTTGKALYVLRTRKLSSQDIQLLAESIAENTILQELYLSGHALSCNDLYALKECLARNTSIQHLCLGDETLSDNGVALLVQGILDNPLTNLKIWDLEYKNISTNGAIALQQLLQCNSTIQQLILKRNPLRQNGMLHIVDGLLSNPTSNLKILNIEETEIPGASLGDFARFISSSLCNVETLQFSFNDFQTASNEFFAAFQCNTSIKTLFMRKCHLKDKHVVALGDALQFNKALETLDLSDNQLTSVAFEALSFGLRMNSSLKSLSIGSNSCGDKGALALAEVLSDSNTTLTQLDLSTNNLTIASIYRLVGCTKLKMLRLFNNQLKDGVFEIITQLRANTSIELLDLGANELHGSRSVELFNSLHDHLSLRTLEFGGNAIGEEGYAALAMLREANPRLDIAVDKGVQGQQF